MAMTKEELAKAVLENTKAEALREADRAGFAETGTRSYGHGDGGGEQRWWEMLRDHFRAFNTDNDALGRARSRQDQAELESQLAHYRELVARFGFLPAGERPAASADAPAPARRGTQAKQAPEGDASA